MISLLSNEEELKEFLEYCERAVEATGNILNERGPLQRDHFRKIKYPALKYEREPVEVLLSKAAWSDVCAWEWRREEGPKDCIAGMRCYRSNYSTLFDTFNGNRLTSTTLWSFSRPLGEGYNQGQAIERGITKLTLTYN